MAVSLLRPWRDARLAARLAGSVTAGCAALLFSKPTLVGVAAGLAMAAIWGLQRTGSVEVSAVVSFTSEQVVEDDLVEGTLSITRPPELALDILVTPPEGVSVNEPAGGLAWHIAAGAATVAVPFSFTATRWGRHRIGAMHVRASAPGSLLTWEGAVDTDAHINVMPSAERLDELLDPKASRITSGQHRSRHVGDGLDFAEIRAYAPGDRLRDLNWAASARGAGPMVNRRHPDRAGEVVVLVDTAADAYDRSSLAAHEILVLSARAAWAVAGVHSGAQDRVGFLAFGHVGGWLTPASGRHARYRLLDALLAVGGAVAAHETVVAPDPLRIIPPAALVIAVSPLTTHLIVDTLVELRARGRAVVCVVPDLASSLRGHHRLAVELWTAGITNRMQFLQQVGIPVASWPNGTPMGPVIHQLRNTQRQHASVRGR